MGSTFRFPSTNFRFDIRCIFSPLALSLSLSPGCTWRFLIVNNSVYRSFSFLCIISSFFLKCKIGLFYALFLITSIRRRRLTFFSPSSPPRFFTLDLILNPHFIRSFFFFLSAFAFPYPFAYNIRISNFY